MERTVRKICEEYPDEIVFKSYQVGKDTEYLEKYGFISDGTMIVNESKFVTRLSKKNIEKEISEALANR